ALPAALDAVVLRAMHVDPNMRFEDASAMRLAIDAALAHADQSAVIAVFDQKGADVGAETMLNKISMDTMRRVEHHLTTSIGPMGSVIARRVAATARNAQEMIDAVLRDIPNDAEKTALRDVIASVLKKDQDGQVNKLDDANLNQMGALLMPYLGPIAPVLVKRHATTTSTMPDLANVLAELIATAQERQQFLLDAKTLG
ncbi:MAG: hypothetical protein AAF252_11125, partial [Pseudomonadota bacterium]